MAPGAPIPDDHMKEGVGLPDHPSTTVMTFPSFTLDNGQTLRDVVVGYSTYGTLNAVRGPGPCPSERRAERTKPSSSAVPAVDVVCDD